MMMLEPVMMVRLDMMNRARMRDATSLAIFNDNMGDSPMANPFGLPLVYHAVAVPDELVAVTPCILAGS